MNKLLQLLLIKKLKDKAENDDGSLKDLDFNKKHDASSMGQGVQNLFDKIASKFKGPQLGSKENQLEKQFSDKQTVQILQTQTNKLDDINKTLIENQIKNDKHFKELIERGGVGGGKSGGGWLKSILGGAGLFGASKLMAGGTAATATAASPGLLAKGGGLLAKAGKFALPSLGLGLLGVGAKYGLDRLGDKAIIAGNEKTGKALKVGGEMAKYAGFGAGIGRFAGPMGMAIGGGVGALVGAGKGIYKQFFSQEQKDNFDKSSSNESLLGFNMGKNDMLSAAAWGKDKKDKKESIKESRVRSSQTFKQASLYQADEDLYNEFNDRKKELEKKEYEKIISRYKNPTAHNELIARQRASGRATSQAMDEFALRAEKVGASTIHEGRDYYKEQEEAYLNRNKGEEKKEEKENFFTRMKDKIKYSVDKIKFNYNAGDGLHYDENTNKVTDESYYNPDFGAKTLPDLMGQRKSNSVKSVKQVSEDGVSIEERIKDKRERGSVENKLMNFKNIPILGKFNEYLENSAGWLTKKGKQIGTVVTGGSEEETINGKDVEANYEHMIGHKKAGGLFSPDKYSVSRETFDPDFDLKKRFEGYDMEISKKDYEHLESLAREGKNDEAQRYVDKLMAEQRSPESGIFGKISNAFTDFFKGGKTDGVGATYKSDSADLLEKQYAEIKAAELEKQYKSSNIVNAPTTTNVSNQNSSNIVKSSPQNEESSISKYIGSLWSM